MKQSLLQVSVSTAIGIALLSIATQSQAAFAPEFYEQRRLDRIAAQEQVEADQFNRLHSGAEYMRDTSGKGKGKGVLPPPMAYVIREEVVLPPLTDTGPALNIVAVLTLGLVSGFSIYRTRKVALQ